MGILEHGNFRTWKFWNMEISEHENFGTWIMVSIKVRIIVSIKVSRGWSGWIWSSMVRGKFRLTLLQA